VAEDPRSRTAPRTLAADAARLREAIEREVAGPHSEYQALLDRIAIGRSPSGGYTVRVPIEHDGKPVEVRAVGIVTALPDPLDAEWGPEDDARVEREREERGTW
jgi:hypothetical protein